MKAEPRQSFTFEKTASTATRRVAIFVAHGMGQQIPFQTMDSVATGLWKQDGSNEEQRPTARAVKTETEWVQRIEMTLKEGTVDVHLYEGYWAPLTEGRITLRNVIGFLVSAGRNAMRNSKHGTYKRWMFGKFTEFPIAMRTVFYLMVTLATVLSLVAMNTAIVSIAAGTALLGSTPAWLTDGLLADLTTTFNAVVAVAGIAGSALAVGVLARRAKVWWQARTAWSFVAALLVIAAIFVVILAGVAIPILFYGHIRGGMGPGDRIWTTIFAPGSVAWIDGRVSSGIYLLTFVIGGAMLLRWVGRILLGLLRDLADRRGIWGTVIVSGLFLILLILVVTLLVKLRGAIDSLAFGAPLIVTGSLVWILLVAVSGFVRTVLVQYLGDVAIYVMPYKLDAFNDLRREIRACSFKVMKAIYEMKDNANPYYSDVVVVGHSLGSVVAYDALNQMIREDEAAGKADVASRTKMLVTFGSPLDKTAFIFSLQGRDTSEPREALAASVQPMIRDYKFRPGTWLNIWTPWDIISGSLSFYDSKKWDPADNPQGVENQIDYEATSPIIAHTEYWAGTYLYRRIHEAL